MTQSAEPSAEVVAYAASLGYVMSAAQLARWHRAGLLPRPRQQSLGRGRGTATLYPLGTSVQVVALCQIRANERRLDRAAFRLWWDGFTVDLTVIKSLLARHLRDFDAEIKRIAEDCNSRRQASRRGIGRITAAARKALEASQAAEGDLADATIAWEMGRTPPPTLDELGALMGRVLSSRIDQTLSLEVLLERATDEDLNAARDRARLILTVVQDALAPLAWLYGRRGSVFRAMQDALSGLSQSDYAGLVAAMLIFGPVVQPDPLAFEDAGTAPAVADDLRQVLAICDAVPGASEVFTPKVVRALLFGRESAKYYMPRLEAFVASHREAIDAVLASGKEPEDN